MDTYVEDLKIRVTQLDYVSKKFGMEICITKTEVMNSLRKLRALSCKIRVGDITLKHIDYFTNNSAARFPGTVETTWN